MEAEKQNGVEYEARQLSESSVWQSHETRRDNQLKLRNWFELEPELAAGQLQTFWNALPKEDWSRGVWDGCQGAAKYHQLTRKYQ